MLGFLVVNGEGLMVQKIFQVLYWQSLWKFLCPDRLQKTKMAGDPFLGLGVNLGLFVCFFKYRSYNLAL